MGVITCLRFHLLASCQRSALGVKYIELLQLAGTPHEKRSAQSYRSMRRRVRPGKRLTSGRRGAERFQGPSVAEEIPPRQRRTSWKKHLEYAFFVVVEQSRPTAAVQRENVPEVLT